MVDEKHGSGRRTNAIVGWALAGVVALSAAISALTGASIWSGFALLFVVVVVLPAVVTRDWTAMIPWPILSIASIAIPARIAELYPGATGHISIATLALVIVVELDGFTSIELSRRFAVGFAVLTTMAIEAVWIIVQFVSDWWFGTQYLTTQTALQYDIVAVTVVSFAIGVVFYWYLTRFGPTGIGNGSWTQGETP